VKEPASSRNRERFLGDQYRTRTLTGDPASTAHALLHRLLEAGVDGSIDHSVLEVGANRGEHLRFVRHPWAEYVMVDLTAPDGITWPDGARFIECDAHRLPFPDGRFDRTIMTCVLHHLEDPEVALEELRRVTTPGGRVSLLLPSDPGLAYRVARRLTSGRRAARAGFATEDRLAHARQHRNHYASLAELVRNVFKQDDCRFRHFPTRLPLWNLNLVTIIQVTRQT
jgi:phosphatidylethanolamine/phosphatidyl-N-methylethanolamine N-methyltransferase